MRIAVVQWPDDLSDDERAISAEIERALRVRFPGEHFTNASQAYPAIASWLPTLLRSGFSRMRVVTAEVDTESNGTWSTGIRVRFTWSGSDRVERDMAARARGESRGGVTAPPGPQTLGNLARQIASATGESVARVERDIATLQNALGTPIGRALNDTRAGAVVSIEIGEPSRTRTIRGRIIEIQVESDGTRRGNFGPSGGINFDEVSAYGETVQVKIVQINGPFAGADPWDPPWTDVAPGVNFDFLGRCLNGNDTVVATLDAQNRIISVEIQELGRASRSWIPSTQTVQYDPITLTEETRRRHDAAAARYSGAAAMYAIRPTATDLDADQVRQEFGLDALPEIEPTTQAVGESDLRYSARRKMPPGVAWGRWRDDSGLCAVCLSDVDRRCNEGIHIARGNRPQFMAARRGVSISLEVQQTQAARMALQRQSAKERAAVDVVLRMTYQIARAASKARRYAGVWFALVEVIGRAWSANPGGLELDPLVRRAADDQDGGMSERYALLELK